ncbi:DnaD and phage-associated domain-containing protein [Halobacillus karajensis]|uniref:DnaD domain-containing protein n=1 Tax=Halobacillus karajensis TaxID=195088 RepID=UPI0008A788B3|nr:DnaD domain protein [Halobacillus karajensis]SEI12934.1 DnaD and phage-associated domain-containing protein [Halobacillus karajensis]
MQGWLKLHRKILHSEIFENEKMLKIFIYCLTKSSHKSTESRVGRQSVKLEPGQFIFGRKKAASELNMNESTVRDYLKILEEDGVISIQSTNKYSVITVDNWAIYQSNDEDNDNRTTPYNQQKNNTSPSDRQQKDTYKNGRELKEVKNVKEFITTTTSEQMECPIQFYQNNFGVIRPKISEDIVSWSEDLGEPLILEAMRRSLDRNKPTWGYAKSILQSWINKGIRTIEEAETEEVEYKIKKNRNGSVTNRSSQKEVIPEWFNNHEEQKKQDINKQPSIDDTARTIELAIKLKRSRENILESIDDRYNLSEEDIASIREGKRSAKNVLLEQLKFRVAGEP